VVVGVGEPEAPLDLDSLARLDAEGHLLDERLRAPKGSVVRWVRRHDRPGDRGRVCPAD
jgi:hypothetical protein